MSAKLLSQLSHFSPMDPATAELFIEKWQTWQLEAGQHLLREQMVSDYLYFIESGVARIYYHKHGKQITEWLAVGEAFFFSITSFFERVPSRLSIHVLEDSLVMGIHHTDLMNLAAKHHEVETLLRKMVTRSLIMSQERMDAIQFETAQQRYARMLEQSPGILQRVPLSYIASFLGITLETLSRIRSGSRGI